jgi:hypothetical protein
MRGVVVHRRIEPFPSAPLIVIACDARCDKAWGISQRPRVELSSVEPDDYAFWADGELGVAPVDPGTYEGGHGKPRRPQDRLNKWCFRECERCAEAPTLDDISLPDFTVRHYNMPHLHPP